MTWMQSASASSRSTTATARHRCSRTASGSPTAPPTRDAYAVTQAESFSSQSGTQIETTTDTGGGQNVGFIAARRLARLRQRGLRRRRRRPVTTRRASGATATGTITYRLDSTTGPIIASVPISNTGGWQSWGSVTTTLSGSATGVHTRLPHLHRLRRRLRQRQLVPVRPGQRATPNAYQ